MARVLGLSSRAIIGTFYARLEQYAGGSWASQLCMNTQSDQESETYKWLGMAPAVREWTDERVVKALRTYGETIINKKWEATLGISVDDLRRDKTGQIMVRIGDMARRVVDHPQSLISTLIINGGGTTSGLAYDGQYYFDTDHSEGDSGTVINDLAAAQVAALNVVTAAAPTQSEMSLAINGAITYMRSFLDDTGQPINGGATGFAIMCPSNLAGAAQAAITEQTVLGASGVIASNTLVRSGLSLSLIHNPLLDASTTIFYVFRTDAVAKPFIFQQEYPPQIQAIAEGSELEFTKDEHQYGLKMSNNVGYGLWQYAVRCTLS